METWKVILLIFAVPIIGGIGIGYIGRILQSFGVDIMKAFCALIAIMPIIIMLGCWVFEPFFESSGWTILCATAACYVVAILKLEESRRIEFLCALLTMFAGAINLYSARRTNVSVPKMVEYFCFFVAGLGCMRHMFRAK